MTTIPNHHNVNLLADPQDPTAQLLQFEFSLEHFRARQISVLRLSLMLSLYLFCQFSSSCAVCKYIFILISRTQPNLPTSLRYSENIERNLHRAGNSWCYDVSDSRISEKLSYGFGPRATEWRYEMLVQFMNVLTWFVTDSASLL
jgi:hypothetical protein